MSKKGFLPDSGLEPTVWRRLDIPTGPIEPDHGFDVSTLADFKDWLCGQLFLSQIAPGYVDGPSDGQRVRDAYVIARRLGVPGLPQRPTPTPTLTKKQEDDWLRDIVEAVNAERAPAARESEGGGHVTGEQPAPADPLDVLKASYRKWYMVYCRAVELPDLANATVPQVYDWLNRNREHMTDNKSLPALSTFKAIVSRGRKAEGKVRPKRRTIPKGRSIVRSDQI